MHESEKWKWSFSVMSDSLRPHGLQPNRLLRPWDLPGKSTGVGCHFLLRILYIIIRNYTLMYKCNRASLVAQLGDSGLIPGLGNSSGEGNGNPLQYFCLENPMDRGAWGPTVHGVTKSWTRLKQLSTHKVCWALTTGHSSGKLWLISLTDETDKKSGANRFDKHR